MNLSAMKHCVRQPLRLLVTLLSVIALVAISACGLQSGSSVPLKVKPGSITEQADLKGAKLTVGSKDFTEQVILGYILELSLSAAGADVRDLTNIFGSNSARDSMMAGQVDVLAEYTGTGWINYLKNEKPIKDGREQYNAVRDEDYARNKVVWTSMAPMDNTYALAMSESTAKKLGITTLSQYAELVRTNPKSANVCVETEFNSRQDGFPGMAKAYEFSSTAVPTKILQTGIIYQATASNTCAFGEVFTTDGRIKALNLTVLADDRQFFPHYNAAVTMPESISKKYPSIATVTAPVFAALTNEEITELNRQVDVDGRDPAEVARDWLVKKGFVTA